MVIFSDAGLKTRREAETEAAEGGLGWLIMTVGDWTCVAAGQFFVEAPRTAAAALEINRLELISFSQGARTLAAIATDTVEVLRTGPWETLTYGRVRVLVDRVGLAATSACASGGSGGGDGGGIDEAWVR